MYKERVMTLEYIQKTTEYQVFERKSAKIDAKALAVSLKC